MFKNKAHILLHILALFFGLHMFISCAVQQAPLGGPKDETGPIIDSLKSTPNFKTNFEDKTIVLYFDEFIQLKDVFNQVIVSPPLQKKPEITASKKKLTIKFDPEEVLRENATYTINFGDAIQDYTESNPLRNYSYVFSTGAELDSLEISGKVINAKDQTDYEGALVLLYDNLYDSVVYKEKPFYFSRTDETGNFYLKNLKSDTFKLFVLDDQNLNYIYDQETESIGFIDSSIIIHDSLRTSFLLEAFLPDLKYQLFDSDQQTLGIVKLAFNREANEAEVNLKSDSLNIFTRTEKDTFYIFYDGLPNGDTAFVQSNLKIDTIAFKTPSKKPKFLTLKEESANQNKRLYPSNALKWTFDYPLKKIDQTLIAIENQLGEALDVKPEIDSSDLRVLSFSTDWKQNDTISILLLPGALTGFQNLGIDTLFKNLIIDDKENRGTLILTLDSLDQNQNYLVELMKGEEVELSRYITNQTQSVLTIEGLKPAPYSLKVTEDTNKNKRWDPGDYNLKKHAEFWIKINLEDLRPNWDLEVPFIWRSPKK